VAEEQPSPGAFDLIAMGLTMAIMVGGGLGVGLLVDGWLGSSPIATFVGLGLGVTFAGLALWERVRRYL
jgi:F0F1-type ATP synthase assembly protein I